MHYAEILTKYLTASSQGRKNFACIKTKTSMLQQRVSGMVPPKISTKSRCRKAEDRKHAQRKAQLSPLCKTFSN